MEGINCFHGSKVSPGSLQESLDDFEVFCDVEAFSVVSGDRRDVQRKKIRKKALKNEDNLI